MIDWGTPLPWLLGSLALAIFAPNAAWIATRRLARGPSAAVVRPLGWLAVSLFYLLPPVFAWRNGALSPYWLGLTEIDWVGSVAAGAPIAALFGAVLTFGWLVYRRSLPRDEPAARRRGRAFRTLRGLADAALAQWHWAFYRALAIGILAGGAAPLGLGAQPLYWGVWLAAGATAAEFALNPYARAGLRRDGAREAAWRQVALGLGTAVVFLLTRNFYLGLALHLAIETLITGWLPLPAARGSQPERA